MASKEDENALCSDTDKFSATVFKRILLQINLQLTEGAKVSFYVGVINYGKYMQ